MLVWFRNFLHALLLPHVAFLFVLWILTIYDSANGLAKQTSPNATQEVDPSQLDVAQLLKKVHQSVDLSGSGGDTGSAYHALHIVYYRLQPGGKQEFAFDGDDAWVPVILKSVGYRSDLSQPVGDIPFEFFPYDVAWVLGEFCQGRSSELIREVAESPDQHPLARLVCYLALLRKQYSFDTERFLEFARTQEDRERKVIAILAMRWLGGDAKEALLGLMSDADVEVATAAGCALTDLKPSSAIEKFSELLNGRQFESLVLILGELSEYPQQSARDLLENLLREALDGSRHSAHLYRIVNACADGWGIERSRYRTSDQDSDELQGRRILQLVQHLRTRHVENRLKIEAQLDNCRTQLEVAEQIETMRRDEYKRILLLQSELIIDSTIGEHAKTRLDTSSKEVAELRQQLLEVESLLQEFDKRRPSFD